jgi:hypothetical protein
VDHQPPASAPVLPPPAQPAPARWNGKTNGFAIASLTMSLFGCALLLSVIFGVIGLRQATRNGDKRGRRIAIAGLAVCGLWVGGIAVGIIVNLAQGPDRDETGAVRGERSISLAKLRAGDCLPDVISQTGAYADVVPCAQPHDSEVVGRFDLPGGAWPGAEQAEDMAQKGCDERFVAYTGLTVDADGYASVAASPEEIDWPGDRGVLCLAYSLRETTGSVRR